MFGNIFSGGEKVEDQSESELEGNARELGRNFDLFQEGLSGLQAELRSAQDAHDDEKVDEISKEVGDVEAMLEKVRNQLNEIQSELGNRDLKRESEAAPQEQAQ